MPSCMAWPSPTSTPMMPCNLRSVCCLALLLTLLSLSHPSHADIQADAQALLAFKQRVGGKLQSWTASTIAQICTRKSWKGVTCSSNDSASARVVELRLPGLSLSGAIPLQTLGRLDALQVLSLHKNKLSGSLPSDLANCTALRKIFLSDNRFSGSLPQNFAAWPLLKKLALSSNNFTGQIPSSLNSLTNLDSLLLDNNQLSGSIPLSLGALPLHTFSVANNNLSGSIPSALSKFSQTSFAGNPYLCGVPLAPCTQAPTALTAPTPTPSSNGGKKLKTGAVVAIVVSAVAATTMLFCVLFLLFVRTKKKQGRAENVFAGGMAESGSKGKGGAVINTRVGSGNSRVNEGTNHNNRLIFMGNAKQTFDLDDLLRASAEVLGKGSLGTSYKAVMDEGKPYYVKRFREVATGREETCKHIEMLGALQHPNLVPIRAYFFATKGKLLVSDYMPKGNLTSLLHGKNGVVKDVLSWEARLAIAGGAAKGVVFLHSKKIVHGNIKATNVLMDVEDRACLTDYSLVQLVLREPALNLKPNAYTPPEARGELRKITYKGDVYAFGVLLLELVTGLSPLRDDSNIDELVQWVQGHSPQQVEGVLDPHLFKNLDADQQDEMAALLHIALPCVSAAPEKRPHMVEVVASIDNLRKHDNGQQSTDFYFTQAV